MEVHASSSTVGTWLRARAMIAALLVSTAVACAGAEAPARIAADTAAPPLWVIAPHPDDEALFGAEPIARALRDGQGVTVIVMTNGDLGCERDGHLRQRETVAAMAILGVREDRIHFLGYPDGHLHALGTTPLGPLPRRASDGTCGSGASTYASRGRGHVDEHTRRTGRPGEYTAASAIGDLAALLEDEAPRDVYVSHPIDDHPDHASTYILLRRAIEVATLAELPRLHRALVHAGGCWPNGDRPREPCPEIDGALGAPFPPLPGALAAYVPTERLAVHDGGALARRAIGAYASQLHVAVEHDWLGTFARGESIAWPETLVREGDRVVREALAEGPARVIELHEDEGTGELWLRFERDDVVVMREAEVLRRVHVPDPSRDARWTARVMHRPDEGGVREIELRRDGTLLSVIVQAPRAPTPE